MAKLTFWYEFASTYSYPAAMRIERVAAEHGVEISWQPFLLGPIFKAQGWNDSPFNIYPAKGDYMWRDMERLCDALDLSFVRPDVFPQNGLLAARVAIAHGIFGAPSFTSEEGELFWGNDRVEQAISWAASHQKPSNS